MFFLRPKSKLIESGFFQGFTDYHSHILPGVDDGMKSMEEALEALDYFAQLKVGRIVLTPHVMNSLSNSWETLSESFNNFCNHYAGNIKLSLGAEYMLDSGFDKHLEKNLHYLYEDKVLVETSYISPPNKLYEILFSISVSSNIPVIAHPERYLYMKHSDYHKLKNNDCLFQLNLLSLSGYYGKQVVKNAEYLLEQGMYDMAGTDMHNLKIYRRWIDDLKLTGKQLQMLFSICQ